MLNNLPLGTCILAFGEYPAMLITINAEYNEYEAITADKYVWSLSREDFEVVTLPSAPPFVARNPVSACKK